MRGRPCDVSAVGRCSRCGRAFCRSHASITDRAGGRFGYVDECGDCQRLAEFEAQRPGRELAEAAARDYDWAVDFVPRFARAMVAAGSPKVTTFYSSTKGFLGGRRHYPKERGWWFTTGSWEENVDGPGGHNTGATLAVLEDGAVKHAVTHTKFPYTDPNPPGHRSIYSEDLREMARKAYDLACELGVDVE